MKRLKTLALVLAAIVGTWVALPAPVQAQLRPGNFSVVTITNLVRFAVGTPPQITYGVEKFLWAPLGATIGTRNVFLGYQAGNAFLNTDTSQANVGIGDQALLALHSDEPNGHANTAVGGKAGIGLTTGSQNVFIGGAAGTSATTSSSQTIIGYHAGLLNTGDSNVAVGNQALASSGAGGIADSNIAIGLFALPVITTGVTNVGIGRSVLEVLTTGGNNVALGTAALRSMISGGSNVALGFSAGRYATGSNEFYVDNQDRTNTAGDVAGAILYGVFNATPASQTLKANAAFTASVSVTSPFYNSLAVSALTITTNTIVPTRTLHQVGAGLIKTITVPATCTPTCVIYIEPTAAYTYDNTGNILVPSGGGTAVIAKLMPFAWNGTKWVPGY